MNNQVIKILVLEDQVNDFELLKRAVLKAYPGAAFVHARREADFFNQLNWSNYDIVLADYHLPDFNGLQALIHIRANYQFLPFIFVTGTLDSEQEVAQVVLAGADGFVLKENLKQLPALMQEVLTRNADQVRAFRHREQRRKKERLLLQKAKSLLEASTGFDQREELIDTLNTVMSLQTS